MCVCITTWKPEPALGGGYLHDVVIHRASLGGQPDTELVKQNLPAKIKQTRGRIDEEGHHAVITSQFMCDTERDGCPSVQWGDYLAAKRLCKTIRTQACTLAIQLNRAMPSPCTQNECKWTAPVHRRWYRSLQTSRPPLMG